MKKILFINTCVREGSRTKRLAMRLLERLNGSVSELRPDRDGFLPLNKDRLERRDALLAGGDFSAPELKAAVEFSEADIIVIAAPYWDLMFPACLKVYLENVTVCGVTFRYTDEGIPVGLCRAEALYYVETAGGPIVRNFGYEYVKALANDFYGIKTTRLIAAEGLDIFGADVDGIMKKAMEDIDKLEI